MQDKTNLKKKRYKDTPLLQRKQLPVFMFET